jgi:hypothetical protein
VAYDVEFSCFRFIGGQSSLRAQDVVIVSCVVGYSETSTTYRINIPT